MNWTTKSLLKGALTWGMICALTPSTWALNRIDESAPTLLFADQIVHERNFDLLIARGHVEIEHQGDVLEADLVSYNEKLDRVTASGHVRLIGREGDVAFAEFMELSGDLKEGLIRQIRMILRDDSKLAAARARREAGDKSTFDRVVYSPCKLCRANPDKDPLWQLKARRVVWDEDAQDMVYTDTSLEMWGVPVFYSPYLSHPAPNVTRRSGFLSPFFGSKGSTGLFLAMPYFWQISSDKDLTITPLLADRHPGLALRYRQRSQYGYIDMAGSGLAGRSSISKPYSSTFRGHIAGRGLFHMTPSYRFGFRIERASDQTYLRRLPYFGLKHKNALTSQGGFEWFSERNYASVMGYTFQGLRQGDRAATTPLLLPVMEYHALSRAGRWGERWTFDSHFLSLHRDQGTSMQRFSTMGGVSAPFTSRWGDRTTLGLRLRADAYYVTDYAPQPNKLVSGASGRLFPQAYADWRFPFVRFKEGIRYLVEPRLGVVLAPHTGNSQKQPNEDSRFFEFNHLNLMDESRFAGLDRIDTGSRLNYGFGSHLYFEKFASSAGFFLGQSLAFHRPRAFLASTGLEHRWSDYVGRISLSYQDWIELKMRTLFSRARFKPKRNEISASFGQPLLRAGVDYILLPASQVDPKDQRAEQIRLSLDSKMTEFWRAQAFAVRDLGNGSHSLAHGVGAVYEDECFTFALNLEKSFYRDRDVRPEFAVTFKLSFKNLGEVRQSF